MTHHCYVLRYKNDLSIITPCMTSFNCHPVTLHMPTLVWKKRHSVKAARLLIQHFEDSHRTLQQSQSQTKDGFTLQKKLTIAIPRPTARLANQQSKLFWTLTGIKRVNYLRFLCQSNWDAWHKAISLYATCCS